MYYGTCTCLTDLILMLQNLFIYFGSYTCIIDLIRSLFWYKSTRRYYTDSLYGGTRRHYWTYISRRAHICTYIRFIYLYRNTYTFTCPYYIHILIKSLIGVIELLVYRGTRRYYKSEHIRVIIHTRSDQTYADTYLIRTLVHSKYRS